MVNTLVSIYFVSSISTQKQTAKSHTVVKFWFLRDGSRTSFSASFCIWFYEKNISNVLHFFRKQLGSGSSSQSYLYFQDLRSSRQKCSVKKEISLNSQKNTCARVFFNKYLLYRTPLGDCFWDFQGSKLTNVFLVVWPNEQVLSVFQWFFSIRHWHTVYRWSKIEAVFMKFLA